MRTNEDKSPVTYTQDEVRTLSTRVLLGDLSSHAYRGVRVEVKTPVPVYSDDNRLLGFAGVRAINNKLLAEIHIDYASEERLLIETRAERLWAWVVGDVTVQGAYRPGIGGNGSAGIDLTAPLSVGVLRVEEIVISRKAPSNPAWGALGEPVLV